MRTLSGLGVSSLIIQLAIVIVMAVANNIINRYGPDSIYGANIPLSAVGIVMKAFAIVIAFAVGIGVGGQPIVGYNFGAGNYRRVKETYRAIVLAVCIVGIIAMLLFELCPQALISLFGNESELYNQYAQLCFRIFLGGILLTCLQKVNSIFLQSMGRPLQSTLLSLARDVVFFVPALLFLTPRYGVEGLLWAAPIADVLTGILGCLRNAPPDCARKHAAQALTFSAVRATVTPSFALGGAYAWLLPTIGLPMKFSRQSPKFQRAMCPPTGRLHGSSAGNATPASWGAY